MNLYKFIMSRILGKRGEYSLKAKRVIMFFLRFPSLGGVRGGSYMVFVLTLLFVSCEEDVVLDLGSIEKRLVVEARVTDGSPAASVMLSYSQNFYAAPDSNVLTNASVELIAEGTGDRETLRFDGNHSFISESLTPAYGENYRLNINADNQQVEVRAKLPVKVEISNVVFVPNPFDNSPDSLNVFVNVKDQVGVDNYFRLFVHAPGEVQNDLFYLTDDTFGKDGTITMPVYFKTYTWGDTVIVELRNLNKATYEYYLGLTDNIGGSFNSIAPGNPVSNMPDDVFGFFAGYSVDIDTVIVSPALF